LAAQRGWNRTKTKSSISRLPGRNGVVAKFEATPAIETAVSQPKLEKINIAVLDGR
jgi:hypothetical protein